MKEIWPNFFIVGAMKAGTSSLYGYLKSVQGVFMSEPKEPHYFSFNEWPPHKREGTIVEKSKYLSLFKNAGSATAIGEASSSYLVDAETPGRIHAIIPNAKIIIILRNPIERAYSHYLMTVMGGRQELSFYDALRADYSKKEKGFGKSAMYVEHGLYAYQVKRYFDTFGAAQVKVLIFEEFIGNTYDVVKDVLAFLGVKSEPKGNTEIAYNSFFVPRNNLATSLFQSRLAYKTAHLLPTRIVKAATKSKLLVKSTEKPPMQEDARTMLRDIYQNDVRELQKLLGRTISWNI